MGLRQEETFRSVTKCESYTRFVDASVVNHENDIDWKQDLRNGLLL
jgi:hypothetical protein